VAQTAVGIGTKNWVINGGFETGDISGWQYTGAGNGILRVVESFPYEGRYCLEMTPGGDTPTPYGVLPGYVRIYQYDINKPPPAIAFFAFRKEDSYLPIISFSFWGDVYELPDVEPYVWHTLMLQMGTTDGVLYLDGNVWKTVGYHPIYHVWIDVMGGQGKYRAWVDGIFII
jgi:hypothetical protein